MTFSKIRPLIAGICVVGALNAPAAAEEGSAKTNKASPPVINLPAVTMAQLLQTNLVGTYKLSPVWTGKCAVAVATGIFTKPEPPVFATNRYELRFDLSVVAPKGAIGNVGPRAIATYDTNGGYRALHTYRSSLPPDAKLRSAATRADLEKALGPPHGFPERTGDGGEPRARLNWSFFSLNSDASLDTLQVAAIVEQRSSAKESHIDSLELLQGKARPEIKPPNKD